MNEEIKIHTIISVYKIDQYAFFQLEAHEITNQDIADAINANQEWLRVPDELEELMQIKNYYFDYLLQLEQRDIAGIIGSGLYRGQKLTVDWRVRELPVHKDIN